MIIESIELKNFRQYIDEKIDFAQSPSRNVTVIHGENGSGKTALLHAFIWCLYGDLKLPNPKNIVNEHSTNSLNEGEKIEASITLKFTNNSYRYTLKRSIMAEKTTGENMHYYEQIVDLKYKDKEGQSKSINNPTEEIDQIIPNDLRTYFFFDGEQIDNLAKEDGSEDIKKAIKTMMGLEILERAINHTDHARKRFMSELKKYGDPETQKIISEIEKLEEEKGDLENEKGEHEENLKLLDKNIDTVGERLTQIEEAKHLHQERELKTEQLQKAEERKDEIVKQLNSYMSKNGYLAFTSKLLSKVEVAVESLKKNEKVTGISESFIDELIKNNKCICGEKIENNSSHEHHLSHLKTLVSSNEVDEEIARMGQESTRIDERKKSVFKDLQNLKRDERNKAIEINNLSDEIKEISIKLSDKNTEEIADLENKRKKLIQQKSDLDQKIGGIKLKVEELQNEIREKKIEQEKHKKIESQSILAEKRMMTCEELISAMNEILNIREKSVKVQLQERIEKVYAQFLRKNYRISLSDDYELNVLNENDNIVAMSQGERQITSLSFIGAIVDIARETYNNEAKSEFDQGGIYPIVMDSPFGALDSNHRERVAKGITKLADQVVVIVSTSQWQGEVAEQLSENIGKEYVLDYNDPRYNKDKPFEYTKVSEV